MVAVGPLLPLFQFLEPPQLAWVGVCVEPNAAKPHTKRVGVVS